MKYSEKLRHRYEEEIRFSDWGAIEKECRENPQWCEFGDSIVGRSFLGSVLALLPSGKIYTPWTTNQTIRDMIRDRIYMEILEDVAEEHGLFITEYSGDLFAEMVLDDITECFFFEDPGFSRDGEHVADTWEELEELMEEEGVFPGIYQSSDHGNLSFYGD